MTDWEVSIGINNSSNLILRVETIWYIDQIEIGFEPGVENPSFETKLDLRIRNETFNCWTWILLIGFEK